MRVQNKKLTFKGDQLLCKFNFDVLRYKITYKNYCSCFHRCGYFLCHICVNSDKPDELFTSIGLSNLSSIKKNKSDESTRNEEEENNYQIGKTKSISQISSCINLGIIHKLLNSYKF